MPIKAVCPSCGNAHQLADRYAFKTVECSQCSTIFPTPAPSGPPPLPAGFVPPRGPARESPVAEPPQPVKGGPPPLPVKPRTDPAPVAETTPAKRDFEILHDEEGETPAEAPVGDSRPKTVEPIRPELDEDGEEPAPRPSVKRRSRAEPGTIPEEELVGRGEPDLNFTVTEAEEEELSEEDDRPVRRRNDRDAPAKSNKALLVGLAFVVMVGVGVTAAGLYYFVFEYDPEVSNITDFKVVEGAAPSGGEIGKVRDPFQKNVEPKKAPEPPKPPEPKKQPEPKKEAEPKQEPEPKKETDPKPTPEPKKQPEPKQEPTFAPGAVLVNAAAKTREITPYQKSGGTPEVATNGVVRDVCSAGGGRYLLVNCAEALKLHVLDVSAGKIIKTIPLTSPLCVAAGGMDHFVIVNPVTKTIDRYSFDSFNLEMSAKIDTRQKISTIAMASRGAGPVVLGGPRAQNNASKMALMFIDLPSLREVEIGDAEGDFNVSFGVAAQLRISPNGQLLTAWYEKLNPTGLQTVRLSGNSLRGAHLKQSVGTVVPNAEGDAVFTGKGRFGPELQSPTEAGTLVPAVSGKWFVQLISDNRGADEQFTKLVVREEGKPEPIATFDSIPGYDGKKDPFQREINQMPMDRRLWLIPEANVLITVPPTANKLLFFPIGK